jgi:hypothetical protein
MTTWPLGLVYLPTSLTNINSLAESVVVGPWLQIKTPIACPTCAAISASRVLLRKAEALRRA